MNVMSRTRQLLAIVRLGRPTFLLGGFALYGLGALCAVALGFPFSFDVYLWGQVAVGAIQLVAHYSNDYFDYHADVANSTPTRWSGGSRVLVRGEVPRIAALIAALVMAAFACLSVAVLVLREGSPPEIALPIFALMLALSWSYSSPPLRLHTRGMGEPTVAVLVPFLTPVSGFILQASSIHWLPILLSLPLAALQLNMLVTLEFSDERGDRSVGKRTWVVLFGGSRVARLAVTLTGCAFAFSFIAAGWLLPASIGWAWLALTPIALIHAFRMVRGDWKRSNAWGSLTFGSVALFFLAIVADLLAIAYVDAVSIGGAVDAAPHTVSDLVWAPASR